MNHDAFWMGGWPTSVEDSWCVGDVDCREYRKARRWLQAFSRGEPLMRMPDYSRVSVANQIAAVLSKLDVDGWIWLTEDYRRTQELLRRLIANRGDKYQRAAIRMQTSRLRGIVVTAYSAARHVSRNMVTRHNMAEEAVRE